MSKIKCQMPKVNKVKLLPERTSGAPPVIFWLQIHFEYLYASLQHCDRLYWCVIGISFVSLSVRWRPIWYFPIVPTVVWSHCLFMTLRIKEEDKTLSIPHPLQYIKCGNNDTSPTICIKIFLKTVNMKKYSIFSHATPIKYEGNTSRYQIWWELLADRYGLPIRDYWQTVHKICKRSANLFFLADPWCSVQKSNYYCTVQKIAAMR